MRCRDHQERQDRGVQGPGGRPGAAVDAGHLRAQHRAGADGPRAGRHRPAVHLHPRCVLIRAFRHCAALPCIASVVTGPGRIPTLEDLVDGAAVRRRAEFGTPELPRFCSSSSVSVLSKLVSSSLRLDEEQSCTKLVCFRTPSRNLHPARRFAISDAMRLRRVKRR